MEKGYKRMKVRTILAAVTLCGAMFLSNHLTGYAYDFADGYQTPYNLGNVRVKDGRYVADFEGSHNCPVSITMYTVPEGFTNPDPGQSPLPGNLPVRVWGTDANGEYIVGEGAKYTFPASCITPVKPAEVLNPANIDCFRDTFALEMVPRKYYGDHFLTGGYGLNSMSSLGYTYAEIMPGGYMSGEDRYNRDFKTMTCGCPVGDYVLPASLSELEDNADGLIAQIKSDLNAAKQYNFDRYHFYNAGDMRATDYRMYFTECRAYTVSMKNFSQADYKRIQKTVLDYEHSLGLSYDNDLAKKTASSSGYNVYIIVMGSK